MPEETPDTPRNSDRGGGTFLKYTLMWVFLVWGIPAIIMILFALNGYLGRFD
ncbi:MAG TPA: hypothetical protein VIL46_13500 [Gemmataceae bacterium]